MGHPAVADSELLILFALPAVILNPTHCDHHPLPLPTDWHIDKDCPESTEVEMVRIRRGMGTKNSEQSAVQSLAGGQCLQSDHCVQ